MDTIKVEKKWQDFWDNDKTFEVKNAGINPYYILVEFPYPSGSGLHVGHVRSYTAQDAIARMKRMQGYNVLFPMGWDAFGAPAERYAIRNHIHPKEAVKENVKTFKGQMKKLGFSFDWSREFSTTDPEYYKWTQWQFLQFYKNGMAYKDTIPVNWCPQCKSVLSNEDAAGGVCEQCGSQVVQKEKSQWMLRMSDYAEDLLTGLDDTHFADKVKLGQINWIGKSKGAHVNFKIDGHDKEFTVFTTRCDTLYGATYCVLAPEHEYVDEITTKEHKDEVAAYKAECALKNDMERTELNKDKTGVFTGAYAINPVNGEHIPIYISDYVLASYGTGAIMAVPAHDERDYEFAKKFNIPIRQVIAKNIVGTGDNAIKEGKKMTERQVVNVIIKHPTEDKYLLVNNKKFNWFTFVMGGIEGDETAEEAGIREVIEETGYTDITIEKEMEFIYYDNFYAAHKDVNRHITCHTIVGHLNSLDVTERSEEEKKIADVLWVDKDKLMSTLTTEAHRYDAERMLNGEGAYVDDGIHVNSSDLDGLNKQESIDKMINWLEEHKCGEAKVNYKMRDWIFSRQRFWGEPIPMINCPKCGWVPMDEADLPLLLPDVAEYEPTDDGESPLAKITDWVNCKCPKCGGAAKRETDTMPNWAGSSWYFLRFMDAHNSDSFAGMDAMKYWGKVNWYNGGMEHTARHLLYARFWVQMLYNFGLVPNKEMIDIRVSHGMILGSNGEKMSKSRGNVINPDDIISEFGADTLRVYEMFIGDYQQDASWSTDSLRGCKRFLDRIERIGEKLNERSGYTDEVLAHKTIKKVSTDLVTLKYNTAVSALMIMLNEYEKFADGISRDDYRLILTLLNPMAPHITEELNEMYNLGDTLCKSKWPEYDEAKIVLDSITLGVQVNGKLRGTVTVSPEASEDEIKTQAFEDENVKRHMEGKEIVKVIVIKGKIVNIVVK
ncbi:MAG: class I tRNA ligase family protein [Bacilli bacterium]|nr:class I tRNA ligase family protein [Bacilli bacterium]